MRIREIKMTGGLMTGNVRPVFVARSMPGIRYVKFTEIHGVVTGWMFDTTTRRSLRAYQCKNGWVIQDGQFSFAHRSLWWAIHAAILHNLY